MADHERRPPDSKDPDAKGKGKQPEELSQSSTSGSNGASYTSSSFVSGTASRIGASAKGLVGDLLGSSSTTDALASSTVQGKAGHSGSSAPLLGGNKPEKQSTLSDKGVNRTGAGLGTFRESPSAGTDRLGSADEATNFEQGRPDAAGFVTANEAHSSSNAAESFNGRVADTATAQELDAIRFQEEFLALDRPAPRNQGMETAAEAEAVTWIAQFHDTATDERSYYKNVMRHARGYSAASERGIHQEDGDEVVRLLDMGIPINYDEDDGVSSFSDPSLASSNAVSRTAEPEVTADDLFGIEEEAAAVARDNPMNLQPDFAMLNPRTDPVTGEILGEEQTMRDVLDRMALLDQWSEVLDSYTDSVWGPQQLDKAREARQQLQKAREEEAAASQRANTLPDAGDERPALRRLRDLMGQLNVSTDPNKTS